MRITDAIDIAIITVFLYLTFSWLGRKTSRSILVVITAMLSVFGLARTFDLYLTSLLFQSGFVIMCVAIVVIFQEDFRRAFEALVQWNFFSKKEDVAAHEQVTAILLDCVATFAKNHIGSLIVLKGKESLEPHVRGGVTVSGQLSVPLLFSIFEEHSPGHDGAVIIEGDRILKLGVHLPLSRNLQAVGGRGTRHTAALGIAERCDALVICTSEETGSISLAFGGRLIELGDLASIHEKVLTHMAALYPPSPRRDFKLAWKTHLGTKIMSLFLAISIWLLFAPSINPVQRTYSIPVVYQNLSPDWGAKDPIPSRIQITVSGTKPALEKIKSDKWVIPVDLSKVKMGEQHLLITEANLTLPSGLKVRSIKPQEVKVEAYRMVTKRLPVHVRWDGKAPPNLAQIKIKVEPTFVRVRTRVQGAGPSSVVETEPVNFSDLLAKEELLLKLILPPETVFPEGEGHVKVSIFKPLATQNSVP